MKYTEARDRSAELLRLALAHMGRHDAAFNPVTFTVWYEYVAGINPTLQAAIDLLLGAGATFDDERLATLFRDHVAAADADAMQEVGSQMRQVMLGIAESASRTGERAGSFGEELGGLVSALRDGGAIDLLPHLRKALDGTTEMRISAQAMQHELQTSQDEIVRLRGHLDRARVDAALDPLTQILNRRGFEQRLSEMLAEPARNDHVHCLIIFDIDHFKQINDAHGHIMGDRVIQGVAQLLRDVTSDGHSSAARYGGEEFAIVAPQVTLDGAKRLAESVRTRTKAMKIRHRTSQDVLSRITVSAGVAALLPGDDLAALIARADAALYRSKRAGRDRVSCA